MALRLAGAAAPLSKKGGYAAALSARRCAEVTLNETSWEIHSIAKKHREGDLNLFPDYQRSYKWSPGEASRLILTILGRRFVPPIVVHERACGQYDVVDGKQRIGSILSFYLGGGQSNGASEVPDAAKALKDLDEDDDDLEGLTFEALPSEDRKLFENFSVNVRRIPRETPEDVVFQIYEDINSGGTSLTPHEIRRAALYGPYVRLIDELALKYCPMLFPGPSSGGSTPSTSSPQDNSEAVLRAFAFRRNKVEFKKPLKLFLNRELTYAQKDLSEEKQEEYYAKRRKEFADVMDVAFAVWGADQAFRRPKQRAVEVKPGVPGFFETKYDVIAALLELGVPKVDFQRAASALVEATDHLYQDRDKLFDGRRCRNQVLVERFDVTKSLFVKALDQSGGGASRSGDRRRLFDQTPDFRRELWERQNHKCPLCGEPIHEADVLQGPPRLHIDHAIPYARGGRTTPDNAQLTHATCNAAKGARQQDTAKPSAAASATTTTRRMVGTTG